VIKLFYLRLNIDFDIAALQCATPKEVKVRGGKAPYVGNALKVMPIVPSAATFYDR
jgi:hypothetical protein